MILYISTILISIFILFIFNTFLGGFNFDNVATWTFLSIIILTFAEIMLNAISAFLIHSLPNKWFSKDKNIFIVSKKERNFYEHIKIRKWKDKIIELGACGGFRKNKLANPNSAEYLNQFIIESNKGIIIHIVGALLGFLIIFFLPLHLTFNFSFWIALVNAVLNILPAMILRYNIPKLTVALKRAEKIRNNYKNI